VAASCRRVAGRGQERQFDGSISLLILGRFAPFKAVFTVQKPEDFRRCGRCVGRRDGEIRGSGAVIARYLECLPTHG